MSSLKQLAIHGTAWTLLGYGVSQLLRLGNNLVLTRLLFPELFGLMALVNTFIVGLNLFSDIGLGPSIIQNERGDEPAFLNTAWTLQIIRGFGLWMISCLIAWPAALFYGDQQLLWLVPTVGLTTILSGFNATALFTLNRHVALRRLMLLEISAQAFGIVVMITWALLWPTIWALVAGNLVSALLRMLLSHRLIPNVRNHLAWDRHALSAIFTFGRWIFLSTALAFLASQTDRLILGKLISFEMLGVYTIAFTLADIPRQIMGKLSSRVIFPVISKRAELPRDELRARILRQRRRLLVALVFFLAMLVGVGDQLVLHLYDERYAAAAWMLPVLALGLWPLLLTQTTNPALMAIGKSNYRAAGNFLKFLWIVFGLPLGFSLWGMTGAVLVIALNDLPVYGVTLYGLWHEGLAGVQQDFQATILLIGMVSLLFAGRFLLGFGLPALIPIAR